ncbi:hypothetical protein ACFFX1_17670 [Dactylosporangium sucinum]|uniref:Uncharacterized protein n=1 Tax=Dactylosporangium sucinum TaxID=1424081 RepID=A0A917WWT3_9ACTN|nr:hypothetical protein [Dactylosporangium sucinum]GGM40195.1 hypothetical protein GCM10007977_046970 [Dactylosporangium sucinum]
MPTNTDPAGWIRDRVPAADPESTARAVRSWAAKAADRDRLRAVALDLTADPVFPASAARWLRPERRP